MESRVDGISMLKAFSREPENNGLLVHYPNLDQSAIEAKHRLPLLMDEVWNATEGSIEEEERARQAAIGYFVLTGHRLNNTEPRFRKQTAEHFTRASIELYGQPEDGLFQSLLVDRIEEMKRLSEHRSVDQQRVKRIIELLSARSNNQALNHEINNLIEPARELSAALSSRFEPALKVFDQSSEEVIDQPAAVILFNQALDLLKQSDQKWTAWRARPHNKRAYETNTDKEELLIGTNKHDKAKTMQLFVHEGLTHALRALSAKANGVDLHGRGLPGYLDAEEGLAVFLEYGFSGELPSIRLDRYVDFGLVLGISGSTSLNRKQLHELYVDRSVVRKQSLSQNIDTEEINKDGWHYVNRIFRGSPNIDEPAVNTKDLAYTNGFFKIGQYVSSQLARGIKPADLLDFLLSARFDPTNTRHLEFLSQKGLPVL